MRCKNERVSECERRCFTVVMIAGFTVQCCLFVLCSVCFLCCCLLFVCLFVSGLLLLVCFLFWWSLLSVCLLFVSCVVVVCFLSVCQFLVLLVGACFFSFLACWCGLLVIHKEQSQ